MDIYNDYYDFEIYGFPGEFIFRGQTEAARVLGLSIASVSMVLSGKMKTSRGYIFEYVDEEEYNGYN